MRVIYMQQEAAIRGATVEAFGLALPEEPSDGTVVSKFMDTAAYMGIETQPGFAGMIIPGKKNGAGEVGYNQRPAFEWTNC